MSLKIKDIKIKGYERAIEEALCCLAHDFIV